MIRSTGTGTGSSWFVGLALLLASVGACGRNGASNSSETLGTVTLPLTTSTNGHNYRLRNISIFVSGSYSNNTYFTTTLTDNGGSSITTTIPTGSYTAQLSSSYSLEIDDGSGNFSPVRSQLLQNYLSFSIYAGVTTTLTFSFQTDTSVITTGMGTLTTKVAVVETNPACQALGTTCGFGRWCPPSELTGAAPVCVMAGTVQLGKACGGPTDCVANASCFDLGSGPTCTAICPSSQFNAVCPSGGTCVAQGQSYGICKPPSGTSSDGGASPDGSESGGADGGSLGLSAACQACSFGPSDSQLCTTSPEGCFNCDPTTGSCDAIQDPGDRKLCKDLYLCITTSSCIGTAGDTLPCWCGSNALTCTTSNTAPTKANGPCVDQIVAAAKLTTYDAATINQHFVDPRFPLGMAMNEAICQGAFCAPECGLP
jgi:hypothetical protein